MPKSKVLLNEMKMDFNFNTWLAIQEWMKIRLNYLSLKEEDLLLMQIDGFRQYLYKHYDLYLIHSRSSGT